MSYTSIRNSSFTDSISTGLARGLPLGRLCLLFGVICFLATTARAHDPGLSSADLRLEKGRIFANLTFALRDIETLVPLDTDGNGQVSEGEFATARESLNLLALNALEVHLGGDRIQANELATQVDESNNVHFGLSFPVKTDARIILRSDLIKNLGRGHRQYFSFRDNQGQLLGERMLDANNNIFQMDGVVSVGSTPPSFRKFLVLGIEHILTGYDHLLFLLALLITGGTLLKVSKIITSFTLAHSITLALATFSIVQIPSSVIEPLIAVSIVYVGLQNIFRPEAKRRWLLTFAFGLVHGFGFASVLRELGIGSSGSGAVVPLFSFNLGVELGQVAIASVALPLIWKLRSHPSFVTRYVPACSLLITLAGGLWLAQRTIL